MDTHKRLLNKTVRSNEKYEFTSEESESGTCPRCGETNLMYGTMKLEDSFLMSPWSCPSCGAVGKEYGKIVFDGHEINRQS